ncbi:MAG: hypothetical protein ABR961_00910, partial [Thermoanaerobaculaceae bacterium]
FRSYTKAKQLITDATNAANAAKDAAVAGKEKAKNEAKASIQGQPSTPTPEDAVRRACDAAGGLDAFRSLGILGLTTKREEVTQEGTITSSLKNIYFLTPGPLPGRLELPESERMVVAADDGSGGWAMVQQKPDMRAGTKFQVKRMLTSSLFPLLLPFSLTWEGVAIQEVKPAQLKGHPVWQLTVVVPRGFFDTPQIAATWTVLLDSTTFALVRADSPFTDLGKGVTADGMRFTWRDPVTIKGVTFPKEQRITGLDLTGKEKTHSRVDRIQYHLIPVSEASKYFANPIPPDQRPKPPAMQPPLPPASQPKS